MSHCRSSSLVGINIIFCYSISKIPTNCIACLVSSDEFYSPRLATGLWDFKIYINITPHPPTLTAPVSNWDHAGRSKELLTPIRSIVFQQLMHLYLGTNQIAIPATAPHYIGCVVCSLACTLFQLLGVSQRCQRWLALGTIVTTHLQSYKFRVNCSIGSRPSSELATGCCCCCAQSFCELFHLNQRSSRHQASGAETCKPPKQAHGRRQRHASPWPTTVLEIEWEITRSCRVKPPPTRENRHLR